MRVELEPRRWKKGIKEVCRLVLTKFPFLTAPSQLLGFNADGLSVIFTKFYHEKKSKWRIASVHKESNETEYFILKMTKLPVYILPHINFVQLFCLFITKRKNSNLLESRLYRFFENRFVLPTHQHVYNSYSFLP